jgi:CBS domain-containing protein
MSVRSTERFIGAYNALDKLFRERLAPGDLKTSHADLINQLAKQDPVVHALASRLHAFRTLRNALVHMAGGAEPEPIATPLATVVDEYERIVAYLKHPPPALSAIAIPVARILSVEWTSLVAPTIETMLSKSYRLTPIVDDGRLVGVFTESTLWQALRAGGGRVEVTQATTFEAFAPWCSFEREVMGVVVLADTVTVPEVERVFQERFAHNVFTSAVFLTSDGTVGAPLHGLITAHDLPSVNPHAGPAMIDRLVGRQI